jgi:CxxC-x17-CxxC domain-containing protein
VTDPVIKSFWEEEFAQYNQNFAVEAIAPIQNKVGQFLSSALIRNIVGQEKSAFSMRDIMDNQKIIIMNLSKGRIGEDNSALLGAMMITKIQLSAMERVDIPEEDRKDFYLYVDEFQNFATESFAGILSEARKYRLSLILAHQYITQLEEPVRDAVMGNVGTMMTFRVGATDAEYLEKEFDPIFYANDLVNLAKYNIYLKLMIDGVATTPFSAVTLPPIDLGDKKVDIKKLIETSRKHYSSPREEVEKKINEWSGHMDVKAKAKVTEFASKVFDNKTSNFKKESKIIDKKIEIKKEVIKKDIKPIVKLIVKPIIEKKVENLKIEKEQSEKTKEIFEKKPIEEKPKKIVEKEPAEERPEIELFTAQCSACGAEIKVPFKPDGKRPVFCSDCLREYRRQQSKLQQEVEPIKLEALPKTEQSAEKNSPTEKSVSPSLKTMIQSALEDKKD